MTDSPYRSSGLGENEATICLFCGLAYEPGANQCRKCAVSSGSTAGDEAGDEARDGFPCPRCAEPLTASSFGRAFIKPCKKCHGMFIPARQFSMILNDYLHAVDLPIGLLPPPLPPGKEVSHAAAVHCIVCSKEMDRVNFASRSDALVDVCNVHGIWLDPGELLPILHFVKTRATLGEVPLSEAELEDKKKWDEENEQSRARVALYDLWIVGAVAENQKDRYRRY
ncbi:MAG: hypothetical protein ABI183_18225 [Polyangiaceae bacterium]